MNYRQFAHRFTILLIHMQTRCPEMPYAKFLERVIVSKQFYGQPIFLKSDLNKNMNVKLWII